MTLDEYQQQARTTALYPREGVSGLVYPVLGLVGEAGEVAEKLKKEIRRGGDFGRAWREATASELGDVLWYVATLAEELGYPLGVVARMNLLKLADRQARDVIKGEGDNR